MSSLFMFRISAVLFHFIPAYILDTFTTILGGRPILVRLHKNIMKSLSILERFIFTEWKFHNTNTQALIKTMSFVDRQAFNIDISTLTWIHYFEKLSQGVRRYLNKESDKTLSDARWKDTILLVLHFMLKFLLHSSVGWVAICIFGLSFAQTGLLLPAFYILFSFL